MRIRIVTDKIVADGGSLLRRITRIDCLKYDELPRAYVQSNRYCCKTIPKGEEFVIHCSDGRHPMLNRRYQVGDDLNSEEYGNFMTVLKQCGENLHEIMERERLEEKRKEWHGTEVVEI